MLGYYFGHMLYFIMKAKDGLINETKSRICIALELKPIYSIDYNGHHYKLPNGSYHRLDGPAYYRKGVERYYIDGHSYSIDKFWEKMKETKHSKSIMAYILGRRK